MKKRDERGALVSFVVDYNGLIKYCWTLKIENVGNNGGTIAEQWRNNGGTIEEQLRNS